MSNDLLAKLRAATRPSRVLDFEIHLMLFGDPLWPATDMKGRVTNPNAKMSDYLATYRDVIDADDQDFDFPRYTASIDGALTLVPEGKYWMIGFGRRAEPEPLGAAVFFEPRGSFDVPIAQAEAATVPLAICAAVIEAA